MDSVLDLHQIVVDLNLVWPTTDSAPIINFGRFDDQPHQHVPLARFSASNWKGILISDEVGLGKTISAISLLRSLHSRGYRGGVLITCPGALRVKWKNELWHRGDIQCIEATSGRELMATFERIKNGEPLVVVASHGILRHSAVLSQLNEKTPELLITIVDEAHHIRNPRSRLHDAISFLSLKSSSIVFHQGLYSSVSVKLPALNSKQFQHINKINTISFPTLFALLPRAYNHLSSVSSTAGFFTMVATIRIY